MEFELKPKPVPVIQLDTDEEILRQPSHDIPVEEIEQEHFQVFLDLLEESMFAVVLPQGWIHAGISGVQIGDHRNVFLAYNEDTDRYDVFINPKVTPKGKQTSKEVESCLSIPDISGKVERPDRIEVTYYDEYAVKHTKEFTGWNARVIQHEYDHLQGVLFIDKLAS